jgi:hypothetical protein
MLPDHLTNELERIVATRLTEEMAPIEEAERRRLDAASDEKEERFAKQRREKLISLGWEGDNLEDKLSEDVDDFREERDSENEEELRLKLPDEREMREKQIRQEVIDERASH